jgi:hypothetical protein
MPGSFSIFSVLRLAVVTKAAVPLLSLFSKHKLLAEKFQHHAQACRQTVQEETVLIIQYSCHRKII